MHVFAFTHPQKVHQCVFFFLYVVCVCVCVFVCVCGCVYVIMSCTSIHCNAPCHILLRGRKLNSSFYRRTVKQDLETDSIFVRLLHFCVCLFVCVCVCVCVYVSLFVCVCE